MITCEWCKNCGGVTCTHCVHLAQCSGGGIYIIYVHIHIYIYIYMSICITDCYYRQTLHALYIYVRVYVHPHTKFMQPAKYVEFHLMQTVELHFQVGGLGPLLLVIF